MRRLHVLTAAQGVSAAGDGVTVVALLLALQEQGASAYVVSALVLVELLPSVFLGPVLAPLLDRFETARVVSVTLALRALIGVGIVFIPARGAGSGTRSPTTAGPPWRTDTASLRPLWPRSSTR